MSTPSPTWILMPVLGARDYTLAAIADCLRQSVPTRLLVINQGVDDDFRDELERTAEAQPDRVFLWSHVPALPSLAATWNRALDFVWAAGGTEALVVNNDVRLHARTVEVLARYCAAEDALFVSAVGVTEDQFNPHEETGIPSQPDGSRLTERGGPDFSCFLITRDCHRRFRFDEAFIPAYCVTPDTRVLTANLEWRPIGSLHPGDVLVGVDETPTVTRGKHARRNYVPSTILSTHRRRTDCLRVRLVDGRHVTCSMDHQWLTKYPEPTNTPYRWRKAYQLAPGWRIATPLDPWETAETYDAGWLAGIIDGEGCLRDTRDNACQVQIAQKPGVVLDRIHEVLRALHIPFTGRVRTDNSVAVVEIAVRRHVLRLLGSVRPVRLLAKFVWEGLSTFSRKLPMDVEIESIEPVGEREVVTLETTSKTYIAEGMISHNCEDLDYHRRLLLAGEGRRIFSVNLPYLHYASGTLKSIDVTKKAAIEAQISAGSRAYYRAKWGGPVNEETFLEPFGRPVEDGTATTPWLQAHPPATLVLAAEEED